MGIPMSRSTTSGCNSCAFWTTSKPSHASPMTSHSGRSRSIFRTRTRHSTKSSATRIVARGDEACACWNNLCNLLEVQSLALAGGFVMRQLAPKSLPLPGIAVEIPHHKFCVRADCGALPRRAAEGGCPHILRGGGDKRGKAERISCSRSFSRYTW